MKFIRKSLFVCFVINVLFFTCVYAKEEFKPFRLGYSISLANITKDEMKKAKAAGIDYIEVGGWNSLVDNKTRAFKLTAHELGQKLKEIKAITNEAGVKIWSLHMPYSKYEDLSSLNEEERHRTLALHKLILQEAKTLKPEIILFHPSWLLGINEREERKVQLIKSAIEINREVKKIGAKMVVENMLGPTVVRNATQEWSLCRSVDEVKDVMDRLPKKIYAAVDMNHIKSPENLILALGKRLKSIHIADGDGETEMHALPCSGKGKMIGMLFKQLYIKSNIEVLLCTNVNIKAWKK